MRCLVVAVGRSGFKAMKNGIITSDQFTADFVIAAAAASCVANATK